jgi:hypothetical protein
MDTKTIKVDEQTHQDLKVLAALRRTTIAALIAGLVRKELEQERRTSEDYGRGPVYKGGSDHEAH